MESKIILGIIPARGGSKGIPRKNIKKLCGKPLIAWKIEAALRSGVFDRLIVSTDDEEIAEVAKKYGAEVPFMRPKELAGDTIPTLPVLQHAVRYLKDKDNYWPEAVFILEPTTPAVQPFHIKEALRLFFKHQADSVVSIVEVPSEHSPHWQFLLGKDNRLCLFDGNPVKKIIRRRQDLPRSYHKNSALYIFRPSLLFEKDASFYGGRVYSYLMDDKYSIDLDRPGDWPRAETIMKSILVESKKRNNS